MTPPPEARNKYAVIPSLSKPAEGRNQGGNLESPSELAKKDKRSASGSVNLPVLKQNASRIPDSPTSNLVRPMRVLNINHEADKDAIMERYKKIVKSPNIPTERIINYIFLCIRGLHYSTNCLKEPSKKFINSRKITLTDLKQRKSRLIQQEPKLSTWISMKRSYFKSKTLHLLQTLRFRQRLESWYAVLTQSYGS